MKHALTIILVGLVLIFCTPLKALSESETVVAADDIMIKMRLGLPVEYENTVIKGNLTSDRLGMTAKQILRIPFEVKMPPSKQMQVNSSVVIKIPLYAAEWTLTTHNFISRSASRMCFLSKMHYL